MTDITDSCPLMLRRAREHRNGWTLVQCIAVTVAGAAMMAMIAAAWVWS
jgi:hypothetical protein